MTPLALLLASTLAAAPPARPVPPPVLTPAAEVEVKKPKRWPALKALKLSAFWLGAPSKTKAALVVPAPPKTSPAAAPPKKKAAPAAPLKKAASSPAPKVPEASPKKKAKARACAPAAKAPKASSLDDSRAAGLVSASKAAAASGRKKEASGGESAPKSPKASSGGGGGKKAGFKSGGAGAKKSKGGKSGGGDDSSGGKKARKGGGGGGGRAGRKPVFSKRAPRLWVSGKPVTLRPVDGRLPRPFYPSAEEAEARRSEKLHWAFDRRTASWLYENDGRRWAVGERDVPLLEHEGALYAYDPVAGGARLRRTSDNETTFIDDKGSRAVVVAGLHRSAELFDAASGAFIARLTDQVEDAWFDEGTIGLRTRDGLKRYDPSGKPR